jgi:hypothetical protein
VLPYETTKKDILLFIFTFLSVFKKYKFYLSSDISCFGPFRYIKWSSYCNLWPWKCFVFDHDCEDTCITNLDRSSLKETCIHSPWRKQCQFLKKYKRKDSVNVNRTSLAFQKVLNVISLVSINFIKHKKKDIQFYILLPYSLKILNLHICASSQWFSIISNQVYILCESNTFGQGGIFIVPHMLWHGTSVFPASSEGPPHLVASYNSWGDA